MGQKRAKIISRDAFAKAFVEGEIIMRRNLARLIQDEIEKTIDEKEIAGLLKAQQIVFGEVHES